MTRATATDLVYLIAIVGFILALKGLSSPKRARLGNLAGATGMIIAVAWTFTLPSVHSNHRNLILIIVGMVIGTAIAVPAGALREDDGDAPDGGHLQRRGRRGRRRWWR